MSMSKRYLRLMLCIALAGTLSGCGKPSPKNQVLATVGNRRITLADFNERVKKAPSSYRSVIEKNKASFLKDMAVEMAMYEEAVRDRLESDKETMELLNEAKKKILVAKLLKNRIDDKLSVTDEELKRYYESHKDEFRSPEMWRASHILMSNQREAQDVLAELNNGASFEELARKHSIDATAARGGDVGFFRKSQVVPEFERACLALKVGQTSDIILTQFGYHIIKLTDKRDQSYEPFDKVKRALEDRVSKEKRSQLFDKMVEEIKKRYAVRIEDDAASLLASQVDKKEGK